MTLSLTSNITAPCSPRENIHGWVDWLVKQYLDGNEEEGGHQKGHRKQIGILEDLNEKLPGICTDFSQWVAENHPYLQEEVGETVYLEITAYAHDQLKREVKEMFTPFELLTSRIDKILGPWQALCDNFSVYFRFPVFRQRSHASQLANEYSRIYIDSKSEEDFSTWWEKRKMQMYEDLGEPSGGGDIGEIVEDAYFIAMGLLGKQKSHLISLI